MASNENGLNLPNIDFYERVRSGVVHQYFAKGEFDIENYPQDPRAVIDIGEGRYALNVSGYARHFFDGATRYRDEALEREESPLIANFLKCLIRLGGPSQP